MSELRGTVDAQGLHRVTYNALQYCGKDTLAKGVTQWMFWPGSLNVTAFDDYFAINDEVQTEGTEEHEFFGMTLKDLQALEKELRDVVGPYDLGKLVVDDQDVPAVLADAHHLIFTKAEDSVHTFALNPDRLRRLSLLKPKGYPLAFKVGWNEKKEETVFLFRYGPTVRGAIALLDENVLKDLYKGEELW